MFRKSLIKVKQRLIEATRWPPARLRNTMPEPQKGAGTFIGAFCQAYSATCLHSNATDDGRSGLDHSPSTPRLRLVHLLAVSATPFATWFCSILLSDKRHPSTCHETKRNKLEIYYRRPRPPIAQSSSLSHNAIVKSTF